jgi:hypothetical protein
MNYTPQQLMGHSCYQPRVRIGNWYEDLEIEEAKFQSFMKEKDKGTLLSQVMKKKFEKHNAFTSITPFRSHVEKEDEKFAVCFGDRVMLYNQKTKAFLGFDLDSKLHHSRERFAVTTSEQKQPVARAVFTIEKPDRNYNDYDTLFNNSKESHFLHFGQSFTLKTVPELGGPYFLRSQIVSYFSASPISSFQEVSVDEEEDKESIWICEFLDPKYRIECEGEIVKGNTPILIKHQWTNQLLGSGANKRVLNDFGYEHEVYCKTMLNIQKVEEENNVWCLVYEKSDGESSSN